MQTCFIMHNVLVITKKTGEWKILSPSNDSIRDDESVTLRVDKSDPYRGVYVSENKSVKVSRLPSDARMSSMVVETLMTGPPEDFRSRINLDDNLTDLTVALWMQFQGGTAKKFEYLVGGPTFDIEFPVGVMGGVDSIEGASPGTILKMRHKATDIKIKPGTHVSAWTPIQQMFVDSLMATDLDLNWEEIDPIQVRWAIKADPDTNLDDKLCLVLEGIPCKRAELESLKPSSKGVISSGAGSTFLLWSAEACWYTPSSKHHLNTMPGIYLNDRNRDRVPMDM